MTHVPDDAITIALVVAQSSNRVIGANGALPWRQKTDMRHFRTTTKGKPVVMGRKTWASLTGSLADRDNIVLTRDTEFRADGAWSFAALDAALACARTCAIARGVSEVCVIGGAQIYAEALPFADRIHLTDIDAEVEGDAWFPELDSAVWREVAGRAAQAGPEDDHAMRFRVLERVVPRTMSA